MERAGKVARLQAAYDGASMVYGRNTARSFLANPDPIGHASVVAFTSDGTSVRTFANYSSETQGQIKYHQYPITSTFITADYENFKKGRRELRNLQDYAKETSEKLRDELNDKWAADQRLNQDDDEDSSKLVRSLVSPSVLAETPDLIDYNNYDIDNDEDPTSQLLAEHRTSFSASNQDGSSMQICPTDNRNTSPNALILSIITPPQSSKDLSLLVESSENFDDSHVHGQRRSRRTRTLSY